MSKLIDTIRSLIIDIESMTEKDTTQWFGHFHMWEYNDEADGGDGSVTIEWPNLAISLGRVKEALAEYEGKQAEIEKLYQELQPPLSIAVLDDIDQPELTPTQREKIREIVGSTPEFQKVVVSKTLVYDPADMMGLPILDPAMEMPSDDELCARGIHTWVDMKGYIPADLKCSHCGEPYGTPDQR